MIDEVPTTEVTEEPNITTTVEDVVDEESVQDEPAPEEVAASETAEPANEVVEPEPVVEPAQEEVSTKPPQEEEVVEESKEVELTLEPEEQEEVVSETVEVIEKKILTIDVKLNRLIELLQSIYYQINVDDELKWYSDLLKIREKLNEL